MFVRSKHHNVLEALAPLVLGGWGGQRLRFYPFLKSGFLTLLDNLILYKPDSKSVKVSEIASDLWKYSHIKVIPRKIQMLF